MNAGGNRCLQGCVSISRSWRSGSIVLIATRPLLPERRPLSTSLREPTLSRNPSSPLTSPS
jgi:hypothetical protein